MPPLYPPLPDLLSSSQRTAPPGTQDVSDGRCVRRERRTGRSESSVTPEARKGEGALVRGKKEAEGRKTIDCKTRRRETGEGSP